MTTTCWSQVTVTGTVIFNDDKSAAPGINVVEKGTMNGTQTQQDGRFKLTVSDANAVLVFTFIGVMTQEIKLNGRSEILVKLKLDCNKDFFDSRQVHIYANSGVINNPVGGQIDIASPWIFHGVIKGSYGYQTDLDDKKMQTGQVEFAHYISNCDFDIDFRWSYRQVTFDNNLDFRVNSFETDLNLNETKFIAGYSHIDFTKMESADNKNLSGLVIGIGRYFNIPLYPTATVKIGLYKDKVEYQASIQGGLQGFLCFIKFYKLDEFNELSLGIGKRFVYGVKRRKG
ncbi:MAG: carboxypeptidase-like regulatory domain-containing protein [Cyclobacteriaceae bacterium]|nr:carboxypeptidase-like regulatory domain-containing protein [Cyclobacteriaceae bacterium]